jgi:leucyl-tRNA synthetase
MSEPNKDGTDIMMALLMGLSGPRASKAWNESQQIKAESFLTMAEHWINQTAEENARLKAEVEQARKISGEGMSVTLDLNNQLLAENARLKTEVEHLMVFCNCTLIPNKELQAKVERLTKAGDAMVGLLEHMDVIVDMDSDHPEVEAWNAAKEGKGQP